MCCKLAKGHSEVTELATKLLFLRFQKLRVLQKKRTHCPLIGVQGPSGSYSDPSIWPGVLPSFMSTAHVRPPCGLSSFQVMTATFSPTQFLEPFTGTGLSSGRVSKDTLFLASLGP